MPTVRTTPLEAWLEKRTDWGGRLTPDAIARCQLAGLAKAVDYAKARSRHYRRVLQDFRGCDIRTPEDFRALPFTTEADLRREPEDFLCVSPGLVNRIVTLTTSGSRGRPKRIFFSAEDQEGTVSFFAYGMSTLTAAGDRVMVFLPGQGVGGVADLLRQGVERIGAQALAWGRISDPAAAYAAMCEFRPQVLVGLPVDILCLARLYPSAGPALGVKAILLSSDCLSEGLRQRIETAWQCRVYDHYGLTEVGFGLAVECDARAGRHMRAGEVFVEIVDPDSDRVLPAGEWGEIAVSSFAHEAMPLLRYRTGDLGRILPGALCPCGSAIPRLDAVRGRLADYRRLRSGRLLATPLLDEFMFAETSVTDYHAVLETGAAEDRLSLEIALIPEGDTAVRDALKAIEEKLRVEFGLAVLARSGDLAAVRGRQEGKRCLTVRHK